MFRGFYPIPPHHDQISNQSIEESIRHYFIARRIPGYEDVSELPIPPPEESINANRRSRVNNKNKEKAIKSCEKDKLCKGKKYSDNNNLSTECTHTEKSENDNFYPSKCGKFLNNDVSEICNTRERRWRFEKGRYVAERKETMVASNIAKAPNKYSPFHSLQSPKNSLVDCSRQSLKTYANDQSDISNSHQNHVESEIFYKENVSQFQKKAIAKVSTLVRAPFSSDNCPFDDITSEDNKSFDSATVFQNTEKVDSKEEYNLNSLENVKKSKNRNFENNSQKLIALKDALKKPQKVSFATDNIEMSFNKNKEEVLFKDSALKVISRRNERRKKYEEKYEDEEKIYEIPKWSAKKNKLCVVDKVPRLSCSKQNCSRSQLSQNNENENLFDFFPQKNSSNNEQNLPSRHMKQPSASKSLPSAITHSTLSQVANYHTKIPYSENSRKISDAVLNLSKVSIDSKNSYKKYSQDKTDSRKPAIISSTLSLPISSSSSSLSTYPSNLHTAAKNIDTSSNDSSPVMEMKTQSTEESTKIIKNNTSKKSILSTFSSNSSLHKCFVDDEQENSTISDNMTPEKAQEALVRSLSSNCCYGLSAARNMDIFEILPYISYHYTLETFSESRSLAFCHEPYRGQRLKLEEELESQNQQSFQEKAFQNNSFDSQHTNTLKTSPLNSKSLTQQSSPHRFAAHQDPPLPWEMVCGPKEEFQDEVVMFEIPHTSSVTCCFVCTSSGWYKCDCCSGEGIKRCLNCCGSGHRGMSELHGHRQAGTCWHCHGTGRRRCSVCYGDGKVLCSTCQGFRHLKCCIKLRVE